ncbi:glucose-1-phosphate cytidylyltransferase [Desulfobaculum bizertense]|uniref:Glucose-1-phosphate cytidylyltransferase n=1 Tax=Desulfobaculum bizertense DSM 18034 TaxID=1121442 RepID=A0A1T4WYL4_9BACT|nr:glucose-1-phosphate cytidylyltransferase [Desulfobaculum bizertense]SKA82452.1 glucose-1-phosphate cytidylyltransferase [Desulfobaculum bizertense DSM 18034]
MKAVIFAGGLGTRLSEETGLRPKPMVEIGGKPILWHIMKIYSFYGVTEFIILTGHLSHVIKDYFINYYTRYSDITVDMRQHSVTLHESREEPWQVTMLYTGEETMTAGRLQKAKEYLKNERFFLTYGDGVADVNIHELLKHHEEKGKICTLTAVQPEGKFGALGVNTDDCCVHTFQEKPQGDGKWINGGFMVCEPQIFEYLPSNCDKIPFEQDPLRNLASAGELDAYFHKQFWHPMDTLKDKNELTDLWKAHQAPWAKWL